MKKLCLSIISCSFLSAFSFGGLSAVERDETNLHQYGNQEGYSEKNGLKEKIKLATRIQPNGYGGYAWIDPNTQEKHEIQPDGYGGYNMR